MALLENQFLLSASNTFKKGINDDQKKLLLAEIYSEKHHEFVNSILIMLKGCFFILGTVSLLRIGYVSNIRITRLREIQNSYEHEKFKYNNLTKRFDELFSLHGQQRFMKDQDQIISRDIMRVIWR